MIRQNHIICLSRFLPKVTTLHKLPSKEASKAASKTLRLGKDILHTVPGFVSNISIYLHLL